MYSSSKIKKGVFLGILAGIIDVIPMIVQNLTWNANLSAFFHWVVAGFLISTSNLKTSPVLKGLIISLMLLVPLGILVGWNDPVSLVPMFVMTIILGTLLGYFIER